MHLLQMFVGGGRTCELTYSFPLFQKINRLHKNKFKNYNYYAKTFSEICIAYDIPALTTNQMIPHS